MMICIFIHVLIKSIITCKVDTGYANKIESSQMVCPIEKSRTNQDNYLSSLNYLNVYSCKTILYNLKREP